MSKKLKEGYQLAYMQGWLDFHDLHYRKLEAELEKLVLRESNWVAHEVRLQSELQSKDQELAELREAVLPALTILDIRAEQLYDTGEDNEADYIMKAHDAIKTLLTKQEQEQGDE